MLSQLYHSLLDSTYRSRRHTHTHTLKETPQWMYYTHIFCFSVNGLMLLCKWELWYVSLLLCFALNSIRSCLLTWISCTYLCFSVAQTHTRASYCYCDHAYRNHRDSDVLFCLTCPFITSWLLTPQSCVFAAHCDWDLIAICKIKCIFVNNKSKFLYRVHNVTSYSVSWKITFFFLRVHSN